MTENLSNKEQIFRLTPRLMVHFNNTAVMKVNKIESSSY